LANRLEKTIKLNTNPGTIEQSIFLVKFYLNRNNSNFNVFCFSIIVSSGDSDTKYIDEYYNKYEVCEQEK